MPKEVINRREGWYQWMIFLKPVSEESGWALYHIDLKQAVRNTMGETGWTFKNLEYLRLHGELSVNHIMILG